MRITLFGAVVLPTLLGFAGAFNGSAPPVTSGAGNTSGGLQVGGILDAGGIFTGGGEAVVGNLNVGGILDAGSVYTAGALNATRAVIANDINGVVPDAGGLALSTSTGYTLLFHNGATIGWNSGTYTIGQARQGAPGDMYANGSSLTIVGPANISSALTVGTKIIPNNGTAPVAPITYVNGLANTTQMAIEEGTSTFSSGSLNVTLHFSSGTPNCLCTDIDSTLTSCGISATPSSTSVTFKGGTSDAFDWLCVGIM